MATRRNVLCAAAAAASLVPAGTAQASSGDTLLNAYFRDKTNRDVERTMSYFSRSNVTYIDAALGWGFTSWQQLHDGFTQFMPGWPTGARSYATRIVGDERGAIVFFTDTPGMFGPGEIRAAGAVNVRNGKIVRWVDYWNGRNYGTAQFEKLKVPEESFPADFGESRAGDASPLVKWAVRGLTDALRARDLRAVAGYLAEDIVFEDLPSHVVLVGKISVLRFLAKANLPYYDARVRHVLNGGYEWTGEGPVRRGITALELDKHGRISRLTTMWDGSRISRDTLITLAGAAIED